MFKPILTSLSICLQGTFNIGRKKKHYISADDGEEVDFNDSTTSGSYVIVDPSYMKPSLLARLAMHEDRFYAEARRGRAHWTPGKYEQMYDDSKEKADPSIEIYYKKLGLSKQREAPIVHWWE